MHLPQMGSQTWRKQNMWQVTTLMLAVGRDRILLIPVLERSSLPVSFSSGNLIGMAAFLRLRDRISSGRTDAGFGLKKHYRKELLVHGIKGPSER